MSSSGKDIKEVMMKKIILFVFLLVVALCAEEIYLGMVAGVDGDSLMLVDGKKVYIRNLQFNRYVNKNNQPIDATTVTFPFTASLTINEQMPEHVRQHSVRVKIHEFYDIRDGRLVKRSSF